VLANFGAARIASFPQTPTFQELGYHDVELYIWVGLFAPAPTPAPILAQLREAMRQVMLDPQVINTFEAAGSSPAYQDAPEFARFVEADSARLIAAVKKIGRVE
jgi:tripartite-type tricarboxylate transporter receptor subunit TctC